jgi:hypothetical protein
VLLIRSRELASFHPCFPSAPIALFASFLEDFFSFARFLSFLSRPRIGDENTANLFESSAHHRCGKPTLVLKSYDTGRSKFRWSYEREGA